MTTPTIHIHSPAVSAVAGLLSVTLILAPLGEQTAQAQTAHAGKTCQLGGATPSAQTMVSSGAVELGGPNDAKTLAQVTQPQHRQTTSDQNRPRQANRRNKGPFAPIEEDPQLPRVLLLGDSISIGYTLPVRKLLAGQANVLRAPTNCGPTTRGLQQLEKWLGKGEWDVIHLNWGLHDLKYVDEHGRNASPKEGRQQVPLDQYQKNLQKLVARLKRTGATLIWAQTTPVPQGTPMRVAGDAVRYNQVAAGIMRPEGIAINDLHTFAKKRLEQIQLPRNVHFTRQGSEALAQQVATHIREALQARTSQRPSPRPNNSQSCH